MVDTVEVLLVLYKFFAGARFNGSSYFDIMQS